MEKRSIIPVKKNPGRGGVPFVCLELEPDAGIYVTYVAMCAMSGASKSLLSNRINKRGKTPLQAIREGKGRGYYRPPIAKLQKPVARKRVSWENRVEHCHKQGETGLVQCKNYDEWMKYDNNYQCPCEKGFEWPDKYVRRVA